MKRILIAYYSRKGQNYVNGNVVDLKEGNTSIIAKKIHEIVGGDLFEIETVEKYPIDYHECTKKAKEELSFHQLPELKQAIPNMDDYDVIFIGYPNWWGTYPMAVKRFLQESKLFHKTVIPFCSHEGSGLGHSESDLKEICLNCDILKGFSIRGSQVNNSKFMIEQWLETIKEEL